MIGEKLGPVDIDFFLKNLNFKEESQRINNLMRGISSTAQKEVNETNSLLRSLGGGVAAYLSFQGLSAGVKDLITVRGEFQQLGIALETILGSKTKADKLAVESVKLAAKTPFTLSQVGSGIKQLLAFQVAQEDVIDTVTRLGNVASGVSVPIDRLILAYGQVKAKGKLMGDDLRQFTEAGIPMIHELAKVFKVADSEISKMVETGKVGFPDVQQVIKNLTNEGGMFFNLMEKNSKSLTGLTSNLEDAWSRMLNNIGKNNEGLLSGGIVGLTDLVNNYEKVIDVIKVLTATYGSYKAATIVTSLIEQARAAGSLTDALKKLAIVQQIINATGKMNPFGLALAGITALVGGLYAYSKYANTAKSATDEINGSISTEVMRLNNVFTSLKNAGDKTDERNNLIKIANERYGEYLPNLLTEKSTLEDIEIAQRRATEALVADLAVKKSAEKIGEVVSKIQDDFQEAFSNGNFIEGYSKAFGPDMMSQMISSLQNSVNDAAGGGDLRIIATSFWDKWFENLSQSYGYTKFTFEDFYKSFSDAAVSTNEYNKEIQQLQAYSNTYQNILNGLKKSSTNNNDDPNGSPKIDSLELFKKGLKEKKEAYDEFEAYKKVSGTNDISEFYSELTKAGKNYKDYLQNLFSSLPKGKKQAIVSTELVGLGEDKVKEKGSDKEKEEYQKYLDDLLARTATYNEKRKQLYEKYIVERQDLAVTGSAANVAELDKQYKAESDALEAENFKKLGSYRWVYDNIEKMGRKALKDYISKLKQEIDAFKGNEEVKLELTKKLADADEKLATYTPDKLREGAGVLQDMAGLAGEFNQELATTLTSVSGVAGGLATMLGANGNPFQMISGAIGIITSLVKLFKKDEGPSESEKLDKWIAKLIKVIQLQEKSLSLLSSKDQVSDYDNLIRNISAKIGEVDAKIRALYLKTQQAAKAIPGMYADISDVLGKSFDELTQDDWNKLFMSDKAWAKNLEPVYQQWLDLRKKKQEYINAQNELVTGTTYDSMVDAIASAFDDGIYSAEEFANSFEDLMKTAILNALKTRVIEGPMKKWNDKFASYMKDGVLTEAEAADLKKDWKKMFDDSQAAIGELNKAGIDFAAGNADAANNLSGAIQGMSQESADLLAGQLGGMRIHLADIAAAITGSWNNDLKAALNTDELTNTFGLGLSTMNNTMNSMRDAAIKANEHLAKIAVNTNELIEIKALLAGNPNRRGYDDDFRDRRIGGR